MDGKDLAGRFDEEPRSIDAVQYIRRAEAQAKDRQYLEDLVDSEFNLGILKDMGKKKIEGA